MEKQLYSRRGFILYLEYHCVCHLVLPPPLPQASVFPPLPPNQGGGQHPPAGEGVAGPNSDDWRESLALCLLCVYSHSAARMRPLMGRNPAPR
jgi:hypothetical protein